MPDTPQDREAKYFDWIVSFKDEFSEPYKQFERQMSGAMQGLRSQVVDTTSEMQRQVRAQAKETFGGMSADSQTMTAKVTNHVDQTKKALLSIGPEVAQGAKFGEAMGGMTGAVVARMRSAFEAGLQDMQKQAGDAYANQKGQAGAADMAAREQRRAQDSMAKNIATLKSAVSGFAPGLGNFIAALSPLRLLLELIAPAAEVIGTTLRPALIPIQNFFIELAFRLIPLLSVIVHDLVGWLTRNLDVVIVKLTEVIGWLWKHKDTIVEIIKVVSVLGVGIWGIVKAWGALRIAFTAAQVALSPIGLLIAVIVAAIAGVYYELKKIADQLGGWHNLWQLLGMEIKGVWLAIEETVIGVWTRIGAFVAKTINHLIEGLNDMWKWLPERARRYVFGRGDIITWRMDANVTGASLALDQVRKERQALRDEKADFYRGVVEQKRAVESAKTGTAVVNAGFGAMPEPAAVVPEMEDNRAALMAMAGIVPVLPDTGRKYEQGPGPRPLTSGRPRISPRRRTSGPRMIETPEDWKTFLRQRDERQAALAQASVERDRAVTEPVEAAVGETTEAVKAQTEQLWAQELEGQRAAMDRVIASKCIRAGIGEARNW